MCYNRDFCINELIADDIDTIFTMRDEFNEVSYIETLLRTGHRGYEDYTDDEIMQEMTERDISYLNGEDDDDSLSC